MKSKRPLGWWDAGGAARTQTKRCGNRRDKILAAVAGLASHPDHQRISNFTHQVLSLAAFRSQSGDDAGAKELQSSLERSLKKIGQGRAVLDAFQLSASEDTNKTKPAADVAARKDT